MSGNDHQDHDISLFQHITGRNQYQPTTDFRTLTFPVTLRKRPEKNQRRVSSPGNRRFPEQPNKNLQLCDDKLESEILEHQFMIVDPF
jgi:hypothetical protein